MTFNFGSAVLSPKARSALGELREPLLHRRAGDGELLIAGHTDAQGGDVRNQALSERRAAAVKRFLMRRFNLPPDTIKAIGFCASQPKAPDEPYAGENRRVEVSIIAR